MSADSKAAPAPGSGRADRLKATLDRIAEIVAAQRVQIFNAMGVISCAAAAAPEDVLENGADIGSALHAAGAILDDVCTRLDSANLERYAEPQS